MQLSLTTAMTQPSALSPFKQRQERQPNQPLEASVADSFTPSTAQAQSRSGANRWGFLAPIMAGSLLFLPSCGIKVEEKAATVLEKATEQVVKSAPAAEEKALEKTAKAAEDSAIDLIQNIEASEAYKNVNAIAVSIVKEGGNEATTSESFDRSKLDAEKKMKVIGLPTLKALSCPKKNGQYPLSFTTGEPLNTFSTLEKCLAAKIKIGQDIMNLGSITFPDSIVDLQQKRGATGTNGLFINLIQGAGFGENPLDKK